MASPGHNELTCAKWQFYCVINLILKSTIKLIKPILFGARLNCVKIGENNGVFFHSMVSDNLTRDLPNINAGAPFQYKDSIGFCYSGKERN